MLFQILEGFVDRCGVSEKRSAAGAQKVDADAARIGPFERIVAGGGDGVLETFPLPLNEREQSQLRASAGILRAALDELERSAA